MDVTETYRELCADLRDFHLADISYRSNEVMKTLTMIATLFMPLSFIAGFYGMNFEFMPEIHWTYGYHMVIAIMVTVASGFLMLFRRKGWI
jgi:magnesium transporter